MAVSLPPETSSRTEPRGTQYPFRNIEPAIQRFVKTLKLNLDKLHRHKLNITKFQRSGDWTSLKQENIEALGTVQKSKATIKQLKLARLSVLDQDLFEFDSSMLEVEEQCIVTVADFFGIHSELSILEGSQNSMNEEAESLLGDAAGTDLCTTTLTKVKTDDVPGQSNLECESGSDSDCQSATSSQHLRLSVVPDVDPQQSSTQLQQGVIELNGLVLDFSSLVHSEQETSVHTGDNEENPNAKEEKGLAIADLISPETLKKAMFPVAGALIGGVFGGPLGLVAGIKMGGMAAVGGGIIGLTGGSLLKKRQEKQEEKNIHRLRLKGSTSLPDLSKIQDNK